MQPSFFGKCKIIELVPSIGASHWAPLYRSYGFAKTISLPPEKIQHPSRDIAMSWVFPFEEGLLAMSDRSGEIDFFYSYTGRHFIFGSDIEDLLIFPLRERDIESLKPGKQIKIKDKRFILH